MARNPTAWQLHSAKYLKTHKGATFGENRGLLKAAAREYRGQHAASPRAERNPGGPGLLTVALIGGAAFLGIKLLGGLGGEEQKPDQPTGNSNFPGIGFGIG